jgi:hypothetical protein
MQVAMATLAAAPHRNTALTVTMGGDYGNDCVCAR